MTLDEALAGAASAVVVSGSGFDRRRRKNNTVLARTTDKKQVEDLVSALAVGGTTERVSLMTPGDPTLAFFDASGAYLTQVAVLGGGWLRWADESDAPLVDPVIFERCLAELLGRSSFESQ